MKVKKRHRYTKGVKKALRPKMTLSKKELAKVAVNEKVLATPSKPKPDIPKDQKFSFYLVCNTGGTDA